MPDDPELQRIEQRIAQLKAQKSALKQRRRRANERHETQRKIVVGGTVLKHAELHPDFSETLWQLLNDHVRRAYDRSVLGLDPLPEESAAAE